MIWLGQLSTIVRRVQRSYEEDETMRRFTKLGALVLCVVIVGTAAVLLHVIINEIASAHFENSSLGLLEALLAAIAFAAIIFIARKKIFSLPEITGYWHYELHTQETTYKTYEGMILRYMAILWQEGNHVEGTAEKIYERSSEGERPYYAGNRIRCDIKGYIEQNYFDENRILLHIIEKGEIRESSSFQNLGVEINSTMTGKFKSTAANQSGDVRWQREEF